MMFGKKFARATVERLPLYYRTLQKLERNGKKIVSSIEIAEILGIKPEQIRKDLIEFGSFGIKGLGFEVTELKNKLELVMGLNNNWRIAIIGAGKLGKALAYYDKFSDLDFVLAAIFDIDKKSIGKEINGVRVYDFEKFIPISHRKLIDIGVIAVPDDKAQEVADVLAEAEVRGIWNFTSTKLKVPYYVTVVNEDLSIGLSALSFYLNQNY